MKHLPKQKLCQAPKTRKNVFNVYNIWIIVKLVLIKFYEIPKAFFVPLDNIFPIFLFLFTNYFPNVQERSKLKYQDKG